MCIVLHKSTNWSNFQWNNIEQTAQSVKQAVSQAQLSDCKRWAPYISHAQKDTPDEWEKPFIARDEICATQ